MRPLLRLALALLSAVGVLAAVLVPVGAASAAPSTPVFPRAIDALPKYETESGCDPAAKPGALEVQRILRATYGSIAMNTPRACSASNSGHEEGRAVDWMTNSRVPAQAALANDFIAWLLAPDQYGNQYAMARRLGISYLIWDSRKFYLFNTSAGWTEYSDCLTVRTGPGDDNTCHRNHVHISMSWAGAWAQTSWFTAQGQWRSDCPTTTSTGTAPSVPTRGLGYVPVTPARLLDTRSQYVFGEGCRLGPSRTLDVGVLGVGEVPTSGVAAVALNVTAAGALVTTWLSAYPTRTTPGGTSSVNARAGRDAAALVVVPVGAGGKVTLANGPASTDVIVDVVGYYPSDGSGARFTGVPATRLSDAVVSPGWSTVTAPAPPAGATGVVTNVTLDQPTTGGFASLTPTTSAAGPTTSTLNAAAGTTTANRAFTRTANGSVGLYSDVRTRAVVDLTGWLTPTGSAFYPLTPTRVVDSRSAFGSVWTLRGGTAQPVQLTGRGGVPDGATSVAVTVTMTNVTSPSHLTMWQNGAPLPGTSDLNVSADGSRANLVVVPLDAAGRAQVQLNQGSGDVLVDVLGYYR